MYYDTCCFCNSNLDPGEYCACLEQEKSYNNSSAKEELKAESSKSISKYEGENNEKGN